MIDLEILRAAAVVGMKLHALTATRVVRRASRSKRERTSRSRTRGRLPPHTTTPSHTHAPAYSHSMNWAPFASGMNFISYPNRRSSASRVFPKCQRRKRASCALPLRGAPPPPPPLPLALPSEPPRTFSSMTTIVFDVRKCSKEPPKWRHSKFRFHFPTKNEQKLKLGA